MKRLRGLSTSCSSSPASPCWRTSAGSSAPACRSSSASPSSPARSSSPTPSSAPSTTSSPTSTRTPTSTCAPTSRSRATSARRQRPRIPDTVIAQVQAVPGVAEASGTVQGFARIIGKDGKPLGIDPGTAHLRRRVHARRRCRRGSWPTGAPRAATNEVVLDRGQLQGRQLRPRRPGHDHQPGRQPPVHASWAMCRFGDTDSPGGATYALFDLPTAQAFVGQPGQVDAVLGKGDGSVEPDRAGPAGASSAPRRAGHWRCSPASEITKETQTDIQKALVVLQRAPAGVRRHRPVRRRSSSSTTRSRSSWPSASGRPPCCGPSAPAAARCSAA